MRYRLTLITSVIIIILSIIPIPEIKHLDGVPLIDKWVHCVMYGFLTFVIYIDHRLTKRDINIKFIVSAFLSSAILGGLLELIQEYCTTCRSGELLDFYADAIGALLGSILSVLIWIILAKYSNQR